MSAERRTGRDDLLERSIVRAKATRSVSLLKLKARCAFNASSAASTHKVYERYRRKHKFSSLVKTKKLNQLQNS